jgi:hypothetical protein
MGHFLGPRKRGGRGEEFDYMLPNTVNEMIREK